MTTTKIPHFVRPMTEGDLNFIRNSWLKSYALSNFRRYMTPQVYYSEHSDLVNDLLPKASTLLACDPEDETHIYAYICFELCGDVLVIHYCYVKELYRKLGLASKLISLIQDSASSSVTIATHANELFPPLEKKFRIIYNPYFVWRKRA